MMRQFEDVAELIEYHLRLHEGVEAADIYKLAHQSVFGPEHLGPAASESSILAEMQTPGPAFEEPLVEPISLDAAACRINLRPAGRLGISARLIAEAVGQSAGKFSRSSSEFERLWREITDSLGRLSKRFGSEEFERLGRVMRERGFPPVHHSESYRECNRPAYRVLKSSELESLMPPSRGDGQSP